MEENKCLDCNASHLGQIDDLPVGQVVVAICPIPELDTSLPVGTVGRVSGHCNDGRAHIEFENGGSHTFHSPSDYIAKAHQ
jgi:hypothetical protein